MRSPVNPQVNLIQGCKRTRHDDDDDDDDDDECKGKGSGITHRRLKKIRRRDKCPFIEYEAKVDGSDSDDDDDSNVDDDNFIVSSDTDDDETVYVNPYL